MGQRVRELAFVSMGLVMAASQGLLIRLLLVSFSGNELSVGLMLGNWMLAQALGSNLGGRLVRRCRDPLPPFATLQAAFALALLFAVTAGYLVRRLARVAPGEALGFGAILWTSLVVLAPLSAIHGAAFSVGCAAISKRAPRAENTVGRMYVLEAFGAIGGGLLLTLALVPRFNPLQAGVLLVMVALATALLVMGTIAGMRHQGRPALIGLALLACLTLFLSPALPALHRTLVQRRWGSTYPIVYDRDSPYGNIAVTHLASQFTFLINGTPVLNTPIPDIAAAEELVHLPLLFQPNPRRILVIGGGLGGVLAEFLKYPLDTIDYAELDPLLIEAVRTFPTELTSRELQDARLVVHSVDGRLLLNRLQEPGERLPYRYDIVLVNLPYPSTLELNRFYTEDVVWMVRRVLDSEGLAVFPIPGSLTYIGPAMRDLNLMMQSVLQSVFPRVRAIPGETVLWLASPSLPLASVKLSELQETWRHRAIATQSVTERYLEVRFDSQRQAWFEAALQSDQPTPRNRDLRPIGVLHGLAYWSEIFAPAAYRLLKSIRLLTFWHWCLPIVALTLVLALASRLLHRGRHLALPYVVATTGFGGMVCSLSVIFLFQTFFGYVYQYIGLIAAFFMAGLTAGGWAVTHWPPALRTGWRTLIRGEMALIGYWLALPLVVSWLAATRQPSVVMPGLLLINTLGGFLVGWQFPVSSQLYTMLRAEPGHTAGVLYAADLLGAFLGAVAVGITLLPVLGVTGTCAFVAVLKASSYLLLVSGRQ